LKTNFIELATKIILGFEVQKPDKSIFDLDYIGVKAPQFSFSRLHHADPVLGVEMTSTGEVGCLGDSYYEAILSAMMSVGYKIPKKRVLFSTGPVRSKVELVNSIKLLIEKGYEIYSTSGTHEFLQNTGIETTRVYREDENEKPLTQDLIRERYFDLIVNIPRGLSTHELDNDYLIRRNAIDYNIPLITNARLASAFITAFCKLNLEDIAIKSWDEM
jgi:carbamoyl-phosphate synthase large subunit